MLTAPMLQHPKCLLEMPTGVSFQNRLHRVWEAYSESKYLNARMRLDEFAEHMALK